MEIHQYDDMPDGQAKEMMERARAQVERLGTALEYDLMTVQLLVDEDSGSTNVALVAHNPCDLNQFSVVCFLPTLDNVLDTLAANEAAGKEVAKFEHDMPDDMTRTLFKLCARRFARAGRADAEFLIRLLDTDTFEEARKVYQSYFNLTEGGDFDYPLE